MRANAEYSRANVWHAKTNTNPTALIKHFTFRSGLFRNCGKSSYVKIGSGKNVKHSALHKIRNCVVFWPLIAVGSSKRAEINRVTVLGHHRRAPQQSRWSWGLRLSRGFSGTNGSGLLTGIGATESGLLCVRMKKVDCVCRNGIGEPSRTSIVSREPISFLNRYRTQCISHLKI
jgi:hypothetical protein